MSLSALLITIGAVAFIFTLSIGALYQKKRNWLLTFLQCFTGVLFIFSGFVKAIDPLGTGYKMEQYFAEFQTTFSETFLSFLAPMFPWLANYSTAVAIAMIVFEIILGLMLLLGSKRKFTSWAFLILVSFFTFLTGFTYLTGYVPQDVNFFSFGQWGAYDPLQMKVTDCGCFGDFLKLEPRVSFYKDLALMLPALVFVFKYKDMHQLFGEKFRSGLISILGVGLLFYSINNAYWDLPHTDFRPFKDGVNIAERKALEEKSEASRQVISYTLRNKLTGKYVELPYAQYMKEYKSYPKTDWDVTGTKMTEPEVPETKISTFIIYGPTEEDVTEQILANPDPFLMLICNKLYANGSRVEEVEVVDSVQVPVDTLIQGADTVINYKSELTSRMEKVTVYDWDQDYLDRFKSIVMPFTNEAEEAGIKSLIVIGGADGEMIRDFKRSVGIDFTACSADDILLKTIIRSNPGVVLMQNGGIIDKWHYRHLPSVEEVKALLK